MEFGKLQSVENITWKKLVDDPQSISFLKQTSTSSHAHFYIGAPAWGHKEWIGKIYPPKTKTVDFLYHYSRNFNCIELNTTHYRIPTGEQIANWISQVPSEFRFCPKLPQDISHSLIGLRNEKLLSEWWKSLEYFGAHLGPTFVQFPPTFTYQNKVNLFNFLNYWPTQFPLCLEFRHSSWFQDDYILPALTTFLQSRNIGLVITDVAGRQDVLHSSISADFTFIRFVGNSLHSTDYTRATEWAERLNRWQNLGLKNIYFIVHQPDDFHSPEMTEFVIKQFNSVCDAQLKPIYWI